MQKEQFWHFFCRPLKRLMPNFPYNSFGVLIMKSQSDFGDIPFIKKQVQNGNMSLDQMKAPASPLEEAESRKQGLQALRAMKAGAGNIF